MRGTGLQGVRGVGNIELASSEMRAESRWHCSSSAAGVRAESTIKWMPRPGPGSSVTGASSSTTWALVPPTPNELTPARSGCPPASQGRHSCIDEERRVVEVELGAWRLEVKRRRQRPVMQGQGRLDQARHTGRRVVDGRYWFSAAPRGEVRFWVAPPTRNACVSPAISTGSPRLVPVPWASI